MIKEAFRCRRAVGCHNLCVLNHEQCELGIEAEFWKNDSRAAGPALQLHGA